MNKVILSGRLTRDPEIKYTPNGKAVTRMGIAVNRRFKNAETGQADVDFFNMTAWEKTAEFCGRYLRKGSRVFVEGRIQTYNYVGQDGVKRSGVDILVENIEFGESKRADGGDSGMGNRYDVEPQTSRYDNKPSVPTTSNNNDFAGGDNFGDDDFVGEELPDHSVPF